MAIIESENGWRPPKVSANECVRVTIPGTNPPVTLMLQKGWPAIVMTAFAADFNEHVEILRDDDTGGWTLTNDVATSNHLNGTAMDLNWRSHPFHAYNTFSNEQLATLRDLFNFYEELIYWGGDWDGNPQDEMHFQMGYRTWNNPRVQDFINRKIRPDGFSTYYRDGIPPKDRIALLIISQSKIRNHSHDETIAELSTGIQESNLNQDATDSTGHRGVYQQDGSYPNRETAEGNVWGFFDRLDVKRSSLGASPDIWLNIFWLQQRPSDPSADVAYANGRKGYLTEIKSRISAANELYNRLAPLPEEDFMSELSPQEQREFYNKTNALWQALCVPFRSKSKFADFDDSDMPKEWTRAEYISNDDGFIHESTVIRRALNGDGKALLLVQRCADSGDLECQGILARLKPNVVTSGQSVVVQGEVKCWRCGKHYPSELEQCPFCGASQTGPAPTQIQAPTTTPIDQVVSQLQQLKIALTQFG